MGLYVGFAIAIILLVVLAVFFSKVFQGKEGKDGTEPTATPSGASLSTPSDGDETGLDVSVVGTSDVPEGCLAPGARLHEGRYIVKEYLSRGGFGITYRAFDTRTRKDVAVKELFKRDICTRETSGTVTISISGNRKQFADLQAKFLKEARRLGMFSHPGIVKVWEAFEENGTSYYVMEFIEGKSLRDRIKSKGRLQETELKTLLPALMSALKEVHRTGILHMDLKPANIMLRDGRHPVLIDFGASKQFYDSDGNTVNTSSLVAFTHGYAPPEQQEQKKQNIGTWTDIYSFGAVIYNALTGETPPSHSEIINDGLELPEYVSERMGTAVKALMQPARRLRPQNMEEVETLLGLRAASSGGEDGLLLAVMVNDKWGYMDLDGRLVIDAVYEEADAFSEGLAAVNLNGTFGYIDRKGGMVIEPMYESAERFNDGLAAVELGGDYGFINRKGEMVIQPIYKNINDHVNSNHGFSEGLACMETYDGNYAYIDTKGRPVFNLDTDSYKFPDDFSEGLATVFVRESERSDRGWWMYMDKTGMLAFPKGFDSNREFREGLGAVRIGDKWGYVDKSGKMAIEAKFEDTWDFMDGLAAVKIDGKYGIIDKSGAFVLSPRFGYAWPVGKGLFAVADSMEKDDDEMWLVNFQGRRVDGNTYFNFEEIDGKYVFAERENDWCIIDLDDPSHPIPIPRWVEGIATSRHSTVFREE